MPSHRLHRLPLLPLMGGSRLAEYRSSPSTVVDAPSMPRLLPRKPDPRNPHDNGHGQGQPANTTYNQPPAPSDDGEAGRREKHGLQLSVWRLLDYGVWIFCLSPQSDSRVSASSCLTSVRPSRRNKRTIRMTSQNTPGPRGRGRLRWTSGGTNSRLLLPAWPVSLSIPLVVLHDFAHPIVPSRQ